MIHRNNKSFLFIAKYSCKEEHHGEEDEDCDGELVRKEEGADDGCKQVGCGVAVFLDKM